ncbi:hypothetical protein ACQJBY_023851 [Aegilops geniculata]
MENSRHSDPSLSAKGSKVAAGSSVAKDSHGKGTMKLKKSDLVLGGDGEDVRAALHGSPEEGSRKKKKRSSHSGSPSSSEASSPTSRKKKRSKRIHFLPLVKHCRRSLSPPSEDDALSRKKNVIKRTVTVRVPPKRFSRHESPSSNTDGEAQSDGEASAPRKKISKRVLDIGQRKEDIASLTPLLARGSSSCLSPGTEALLAEEIETPKQKKNDYSQPGHPASQGAADVSLNPHALVVDNCLNANLRMDKSIPPASLGNSTSEEITWTREKKGNTPIPVTEEKVPADEKQEKGPEEKEKEELLLKGVRLTDKLNSPYKLDICSTCDERQQAEIYLRLSRYYSKALQLSGQEQDDAQLNEEAEVPLDVYENIFLERVKDDREWYFDPEQCKLAGLEDYQRLVLRDDCTYRDWEAYRLTYHTYQGDLEYVQFREMMSEKLKVDMMQTSVNYCTWLC